MATNALDKQMVAFMLFSEACKHFDTEVWVNSYPDSINRDSGPAIVQLFEAGRGECSRCLQHKVRVLQR